jgi:hypothetical protein
MSIMWVSSDINDGEFREAYLFEYILLREIWIQNSLKCVRVDSFVISRIVVVYLFFKQRMLCLLFHEYEKCTMTT